MKNKRLRRCLALCALAVALSLAFAVWNAVSVQKQRAAEALAAQQAAEQAAAEQAAAEEAARQAEAERQAAEQAALRAEQLQEAAARHDSTEVGDCLGTVWVEGTDVSCPLYWGDGETQFAYGAGCRATDGCVLPGENGTVFIGGHTGTFFADLGSTELGAIIHLDTEWGDFTYRVTDMQVIEETDIDLCRWGAEEPSCILYTCYPFGILTHTKYRYAVYADPVAADADGVIPDVTATPETAAN